ncbi:collagen binding domain-containing protein [Nocardioides sp. R1-1]|uniref:MSCRAMM family protein n=1 Tax=Nocardioides sp. R1-1 TaxID=3383502 RepID=UPI0038D2237F
MIVRVLMARLLAVVVAVAGVSLGWSTTTAHAAVPPGEIQVEVSMSDGGELEGTAYLYRWDSELGDFDFEADSVVLGTGTASVSFTELTAGDYYVQVEDDFGSYEPAYSGGASSPPTNPGDPGVVTITASAGATTTVTLTPTPPGTAVSGTVVDAVTDAGIVGAWVEASGDEGYDETDTGAGGAYALELQPGSYEVTAGAEGYVSSSVDVEVTTEAMTVPPIELAPLAPGLYVEVYNSTFGSAVANAQVSLQLVGGGAPTVQTTDEDGAVVFAGIAPGTYMLSVAAGPGYVADAPVEVVYDGGYESAELAVSVDFSCEPAAASTGLTNMGFEDEMAGWTLGFQTEGISAVGADTFTSPWEGSKMARIGSTQPSDEEDQPEGPNIMCQDFVVDQAEETFAFNVFTYDYTGFDELTFDVVVSSPDTGETLAAYQQGAWGEGTDLKTSGWRGVQLDLSGHLGETVRLTFRAGGTRDNLYAFWAYLDSAATLPPTIQTSTADVVTTTGSVTTDPVTGQVTVAMPSGSPSDLTLTVPADCVDTTATPSAVQLVLGGATFPATANPNGTYTATIPEADIETGPLSVQVDCPEETTLVVPIGRIVLYDPSGIVTNKLTGQPVVGAEVRLYKVPGWEPQDADGPHPADSCQTNLSKASGAPWSQPAPTGLGQLVQAASPEISPNVNPFVTNAVGYYGWDVAEGCWYVVVSKPGYKTLTSPVVGVPTAVTDLNLQLEPNAVVPPGPSAGCTAAKAGLATAQAALADAQAKVTKAKAKLKKAKKSGSAAKVKKAKKGLKKAKGQLAGASTGLANAQANVGKHC